MKRNSCLILLFTALLLSLQTNAQDWTSTQTINEPNGSTSNIDFGQSLAVDGSLAVVGVPLDNSAHVYELVSGTWTYRVTLSGSDVVAGNEFGYDVDVEGDVIVIGAPSAGSNSEGQVYIWERPAGGWELATNEDIILTNSAASPNLGRFGHAIDLNGDELLIGAPYQTVGSDTNHGQVYLFSKASGASWKTSSETANFLHPVSFSDYLGYSVALESDFLAVGAPQTGGNAGNGFIFEKSGGNWITKTTADAVLRKPNRSSTERFGTEVTSDGDYVIFSAGGISVGHLDVYVFRTPAVGWSTEYANLGTLEPEYTIARDPSSIGGTYGFSMSASYNLLAVGDRRHGFTNSTAYGRVWIYELGTTSETLVEEVQAPTPTHIGEFGFSVALDGNQLVVGAPDHTIAGQVFAYTGEYQVSVNDVICFNGSYSFDGQNLTSAGTYNATFTASNGLDSLVTLTLTQNPQLNFAFNFDPILCNGETGGVTFDSPSGGDGGPYEYSVDGVNFQTSPTFSGLSAGPLTLVLRDGASCTRTEGTTLQEPAEVMITSSSVTDPSCFNANNGSITLQVSGGTSGYYYSTDGTNYQFNGAGINTTVTVSSLVDGTYTVYVKDGNDCEKTIVETLTQPSDMVIAATLTDPSCNGLSDGSINSINVTGGNGGPYTYSLNGGAFQSANGFTGLTAGQHLLVVEDNNGCFANETFTLTDPSAISATATLTNSTSCSTPDGSIDLTVSGGTGSYTYTIDGSPTNLPITGLSAGTYSIEITDANGCSITLSESISEPAGPQVAGNFDDPQCFGANDGTFSAVGFNGTPPYEYSFNGGAFSSSQSISGLGPGSHSVTVRDANGCTGSASVFLIEPSQLTINSASGTDLTCHQGGDGSISLTMSGGTPIYYYSLDGTNFSNFNTLTNATIENLDAGTYNITIRDANDCTVTTSVTLSEPVLFDFSSTVSNVSCFGESDGSVASITPTGGNGAPYMYSLDGVNYQSTSSFVGLPAGQVTIYVQDASGCEISKTTTISEPTAIVPSVTKMETSTCGATDGQLDITATGGVGPYTFSLNGGASQSSGAFSGLGSGVYAIDITDATGCVATVNEVISDPVTATITTSSTDAFCGGSMDGTITVSVSGGTAPYEYSLDGGAFQTSNIFNGLDGGTYAVNVKEANGCIQTVSASVNEPDPSLPVVGSNNYSTTYGSAFSSWSFSLDPTDMVSTHFLVNNVQGLGLALGTTPLIGDTWIAVNDLSSLTLIPESAGTVSFDVQATFGTTNISCASGNPMSVSVTVDPAMLTVTAEDKSRRYGEANPTLTYTYSGFVNGEDEGSLATFPSISTQASSGSDVGSYDIVPSNASAANYNFSYVNGTLSVTTADLEVTANDKAITFGDALPSLDGTITGALTSDNVSGTYATNATSSSDAGSYDITATLVDPGNRLGNYSVTNNSGTLTIAKADQTISFTAIDDIDLINTSTVTLSATSSVGLPITYAITAGQSIATVSGNVITATGTGNVSVEAQQVGNVNYNAASASESFMVVDSRKTDQTITFSALSDKTYGDVPFTLGATASSGLTIQYSLTGPATLSGGEITITGVGQVTVSADQAGDNSFNPAPTVSQSFTVQQAALTVEANDKSMIYGDQVPTLDGSISGIQYNDDITVSYSSSGDGLQVGDFSIEATLTDPDSRLSNYTVSNTSGTLSVAKASLSVTANDYQISFGDDIPSLEGVVSGIKNNDNISATYSTAATSSSDVGSYSVEASLTDPDSRLDNYTVTNTAGTLTIVKADQSISFDAISNIDIAVTNTVNLVANANSGLAVTFTLEEGDGSISGSTLTANSSGNYSVRAEQEGNSNYNAAIPATQSFQVTDSRKLDQTITFGSLANRIYGETFTVSATSSSQLPVSFAASGPASVSGSDVTVTGVGEVIITASQVGNGDYNPALDVSQSFTAEKAQLTATADDKTISEGDVIPALTLTYSGFVNGEDVSVLDEEPTLSTNATSTSAAGEYDITLAGGTDDNYAFTLVDGTLTIEQVLGLSADPSVEIYPNPLTDYLIVTGEDIKKLEIRDLSGRILLKSDNQRLDTSDLNAGIYLLIVKDSEGKTVGQARIKKND